MFYGDCCDSEREPPEAYGPIYVFYAVCTYSHVSSDVWGVEKFHDEAARFMGMLDMI